MIIVASAKIMTKRMNTTQQEALEMVLEKHSLDDENVPFQYLLDKIGSIKGRRLQRLLTRTKSLLEAYGDMTPFELHRDLQASDLFVEDKVDTETAIEAMELLKEWLEIHESIPTEELKVSGK